MKRIKPKWILCALLTAPGLFLIFCLVGYKFGGCFLLGLAALIPVYHFLRNRGGLRRMLTFLLAVFFTAMAVTGSIIARSARGTENPESDYLIVLGAGVNGSTPSLSLWERITAAYDYLAEHPDAVAIVSGGQGNGEDITEAACMYNELTKLSIAHERIWMEDQATSTLENLRFSLDLIEARTGERPVKAAIVSSEYHLHRAGMFAESLGLEAELVPARTSYPVLRTNYYLREIFAVWYYSIFGG